MGIPEGHCAKAPAEKELFHLTQASVSPRGVPLLQAAMRAAMSEEEGPGARSQVHGMNKPGVTLFPDFPSSQFTKHSPFRPLVRLGLEPRLVLGYPGEVKGSGG